MILNSGTHAADLLDFTSASQILVLTRADVVIAQPLSALAPLFLPLSPLCFSSLSRLSSRFSLSLLPLLSFDPTCNP